MLSILAFFIACSDAESEQKTTSGNQAQSVQKSASPPPQAVTEVKEKTPDGDFYCYQTQNSTFAIWPVPNSEMGEMYYDFWPAGTACKYQKGKTSTMQSGQVKFIGATANKIAFETADYFSSANIYDGKSKKTTAYSLEAGKGEVTLSGTKLQIKGIAAGECNSTEQGNTEGWRKSCLQQIKATKNQIDASGFTTFLCSDQDFKGKQMSGLFVIGLTISIDLETMQVIPVAATCEAPT